MVNTTCKSLCSVTEVDKTPLLKVSCINCHCTMYTPLTNENQKSNLCCFILSVTFMSSTCSCQWVLPCRANQDCISDPRHQQKSDLLAVSACLDFYWFSVSEVEREREGSVEPGEVGEAGEDGTDESEGSGRATLMVECLGVLKRKDLGAELRQLDRCEFFSSDRLWPVPLVYYLSAFNLKSVQ